MLVFNFPPLLFQDILYISQAVPPSSCLRVALLRRKIYIIIRIMEDKRKKRSPKVSLPQPPPPPINPRKLSVLPASKSATFSLGLPQPPSPKNRGKYKRSIGAPGQPKEMFATVVAPPKTTRFVCKCKEQELFFCIILIVFKQIIG